MKPQAHWSVLLTPFYIQLLVSTNLSLASIESSSLCILYIWGCTICNLVLSLPLNMICWFVAHGQRYFSYFIWICHNLSIPHNGELVISTLTLLTSVAVNMSRVLFVCESVSPFMHLPKREKFRNDTVIQCANF